MLICFGVWHTVWPPFRKQLVSSKNKRFEEFSIMKEHFSSLLQTRAAPYASSCGTNVTDSTESSDDHTMHGEDACSDVSTRSSLQQDATEEPQQQIVVEISPQKLHAVDADLDRERSPTDYMNKVSPKIQGRFTVREPRPTTMADVLSQCRYRDNDASPRDAHTTVHPCRPTTMADVLARCDSKDNDTLLDVLSATTCSVRDTTDTLPWWAEPDGLCEFDSVQEDMHEKSVSAEASAYGSKPQSGRKPRRTVWQGIRVRLQQKKRSVDRAWVTHTSCFRPPVVA